MREIRSIDFGLPSTAYNSLPGNGRVVAEDKEWGTTLAINNQLAEISPEAPQVESFSRLGHILSGLLPIGVFLDQEQGVLWVRSDSEYDSDFLPSGYIQRVMAAALVLALSPYVFKPQ